MPHRCCFRLSVIDLRVGATLVVWCMVGIGVRAEAPRAQDRTESCRRFVQSFYDWYVPIALQDTDTWAPTTAIKARPASFDKRLAQLLTQDDQAQQGAADYVVTFEGDPLLLAQDLADHYTVTDVRIRRRSTCEATVHSLGPTLDQHAFVATLKARKMQWRFADFREVGRPESASVIHTLEGLASQRIRESQPKKH